MAILVASLPLDMTNFLADFSEDGDDEVFFGYIRSDYPDGSFQFYFYSPAPLSSRSVLTGFEHFLPGGAQAVDLSQLSVPILTYLSYADRNDAVGLTAFMFRGNDLLYSNQEGDDVLLGFAGNDTFFDPDAGDALIGGSGVDVLAFILGSGPPQAVDLDDSFFRYKKEIEAVELRVDAAGHSIVLGERSEQAGINIVSAKQLGTASSVTLDASARGLAIQLTGSAGNDTLLGGGGKDTLVGGLGNDTYRVGTGDIVTEAAGAGFDEVFSASSFTLSPNLEKLTLTGTADSSATGNSGINTLIGNLGNNRLDGGAGADTLNGGAGNDTYILNDADTIEVDPSGNDTVETAGTFDLRVRSGSDLENVTLVGALAVNATGNEFANVLRGNAAANTLDGGGGADDLQGGLGNDTYLVDNVGDLITEALRSGTDAVKSAVSYTLSANVESLTLLAGFGEINASGNALANLLLGNESNNRLDGAAGADDMRGGLGDDTYVVDSASDKVTELLNQGENDTVESWITLALMANVEHLTLVGSSNLNAAGNALGNTLAGNSGNNTLDGKAGNDTLQGGLGNDTYLFAEGDTIVEAEGEGSDTVQIGRSVDLTTEFDNVENITLTIAGAFNLTGDEADNHLKGNASANTLTGNGGNDRLEGGAGVDTLNGGQGDDTYVLNGADIIETDIGGNDTLETAGTFDLRTRVAGDLENITLVGTLAVHAIGNDEVNILKGNAAANILDGRGGADIMMGGGGNDTYYVDDEGDDVVETIAGAAGGTDRVEASASYSLDGGPEPDRANVEYLTLTGTGNINGIGNALGNILAGNSGNNVLAGLDGNDILSGNDGHDTLNGGTGQDTLNGNAGNDRLDGGAGNDTMGGGLGDDVYVVDSTLDKITENLNTGEDTVESWVSHTLATNVDHLMLMGTALTATGNALENELTGNDANNTLDGKAGADTLIGGAGNDFYVLDNVGDTVVEEMGDGSDTVQVGYAARGVEEIKLGEGMYAHIENVTITGIGAFKLTGDDGDNLLMGNASANVLIGGVGDDVLIGQGGIDTMFGGEGDDIYYVDSIGDKIVEASFAEFEVELVSTLSNGEQSGRDSNWPTVSGDGRYVVFESPSPDFSTPTSTFNPHLFLKDIETGVLTKINDPLPDARNPIAPGSSRNAILSGDGSVVGFTSIDPYLVRANPGIFDENVYASETSGEFRITLVSQKNGQFTTEGFTYLTDVSYDGNYFVYTGNDPDVLGPDGNNTSNDVVLVDRSEGTVTVVSFSGVTPAPHLVSSSGGKISGDGRYVGFRSNATDLVANDKNGQSDIFIRDMHEPTPGLAFRLASTASSGAQANNICELVDLSGNGRYVLFDSEATNLVAGDTNGKRDVFLKDMQTGETARVSVSASGAQANGGSLGYAISADGRYVLLGSSASNLAPVDPAGMGADLYVKDMTTGLIAVVSRSEQGLSMPNALGGYAGADLSEDGRYVVFKSPTSLVENSGSGIYRVTNPLFQTASGGVDEIRSTISYALGAGIEKLTLLGTAISGTGNELANVITGNAAANILSGGAGADTLDGGLGTDTLRGGADNDTYRVNVTADKVEEGANAGIDTVRSSAPVYTLPVNTEVLVLAEGTANLNGTGNTVANILIGNDGNNLLDGKSSADSMTGGAGNDTYVVDVENDVIVELDGGGTDTVQSGATEFTLPEHVENLVLTGTSVTETRNGTGNALGNKMSGNVAPNFLFGLDGDDFLFGAGGSDTLDGGGGNDELDGQTGSDFLHGGEGDDIYYLDSADDVIIEQGIDDTDTVKSYVALDRLFDNVENAVLLGSAAIGASGNDLDNFLKGNGGKNALRGGAGNDILDGGTGVDTMKGDGGDDEYFVDSALDQVVEIEGEGDADKINTTLTLPSLAVNVEMLELLGTAALNGTGNAGNNTIYGNNAANILRGGDGDDRLMGRGGNDFLYGDSGTDILLGGIGDDVYVIDDLDTILENISEGIDTVLASHTVESLADNVEKLVLQGVASINGTGNELNNALTGNASANSLFGRFGNDVLVGNAGNDTLDGDEGDDIMQGGAGNDTYYVDSLADAIIELANAGTDEVHAIASHVLAANVENLFLGGNANLTGTGNALANLLTGNSGDNILNGGAGNDTLNGGEGIDTLIGGLGSDIMSGGMGDDIYYVDNAGDRAIETDFSHGIDSVYSTVSFLVGSLVENLYLLGAAAIDGVGNFGNNTIVGNSGVNRLNGFDGDDILDGGAGADTLSGDMGNDTFIFDPLDASVNGSLGNDTLKVEGSGKDLVMAGTAIFKSIEIIDIIGTGDNSLYITAAQVQYLSENQWIKVIGDAGDSVRSADQGWIQGLDQMEDGITYHTYAIGEVGLWVDSDVTMVIS